MKRIHRNKELTEVQVLKKENKYLKKVVTELKRELKYYKNREHFHETTVYEDPEQLPLFEESRKCPSCGKGNIIQMNVVGRNWEECDICDWDTRKLK